MKTFRNLASKWWYILLCTLIVACSDSSETPEVEPTPEPEPTPVKKDYELADNVIELEGDLLKHVASVKGDTLIYNSNTPNDVIPEVDEIVLVTQPTDVFPNGFLGKVTKVSKDGNVFIVTEAVALDEVFIYLNVEGTYELEPVDTHDDGRASDKFSFVDKFGVEVGDYVKSELELKTNVVLNINLYVDKRNGKQVRSGYIDIDLENQTNFNISYAFKLLEQKEDSETKKLGDGFKVGQIVAGPIIITPTIQPYIKSAFEGSMNMGWGFETWARGKFRLNFAGKDWSLSSSKDEWKWTSNANHEMEISGSAFLGAGIALEFRFYNNKNINMALNSQLGVEASGEVGVNLDDFKKNGEEEFYNQLEDSKVALALKGGVGLEASAKIFFLEAKWEHPLYEKTFLTSESHVFPSFKDDKLKYSQGKLVASTDLRRNLLWKQDIGLALYKGDECVERSDSVEYKFEEEFKEENPLEATFEDIPEEEKNNYSIWSFVKWGDTYIKCKQLVPQKRISRMRHVAVHDVYSEEKIYSFSYDDDLIDYISTSTYYNNELSETESYKFTYLNDSVVNVVMSASEGSGCSFDMTLNKDGYIKSCRQTSNDDGSASWVYEYNQEGQMISMKRSEENETWKLSYADSNVISTTCNGVTETNISYGNQSNVSNLVMHEYLYGIDIDEMEIFGLIGMLGKPSNDLPSNKHEYSEGAVYTYNYNWTKGGDGYPSVCSVTTNDYHNDVIHFTWE